MAGQSALFAEEVAPALSGSAFADRVAEHLRAAYWQKELIVRREVHFGRGLHGQRRKLDIMATCGGTALALECKFKASSGSIDEKLTHALADAATMPFRALVVYGGDGWTVGAEEMLKAHRLAVRFGTSSDEWELHHQVVAAFGWWEML
ncbi:MAG: PD-(D/E)XK nuclease superfamily protein [Alphaproteobacteria bacterium]